MLALVATALPTPIAAAAYTPHGPIHIDGDADLAAQALAEGWSGIGTPTDPVVIADLELDPESGTAFWLANTTLSVALRGSHVLAGGGWSSVYVNASPAFALEGDLVESSSWTSTVHILGSNGSRVADNDFTGTAFAMLRIEASDDVVVEINVFDGPMHFAIDVDGGTGLRVRDNTLTSPGGGNWGIEVTNADDTIVERNTITGRAAGIQLLYRASGAIRDNEVDVTTRAIDVFGSAAAGSVGVVVERNEIANASTGILSWYSEGLVVQDNVMSLDGIEGAGVDVVEATGALLTRNTITRAGVAGIIVFRCAACDVLENDITGVGLNTAYPFTSIGIYLVSTANAQRNVIRSTHVGFQVTGGDGTTVTDNDVSDTLVGGYFLGAYRTVFTDNALDVSKTGISIESSSDLTFTDLSFDGLTDVAVRVRDSVDVDVLDLTVRDAGGVASVDDSASVTFSNINATGIRGDAFSTNRTDALAIEDVRVDGDGRGVRAIRADDLRVERATMLLRGNGLHITSSSDVLVRDVELSPKRFSDVALVLQDGADARIENVTAALWDTGVLLQRTSGTTLTRSHFTEDNLGIRTIDAIDILVYDNVFANGYNAIVDRGSGARWSVDPTPGTNVLGGSLLGGNSWSDYLGADADGDGLGDVSYGPIPYETPARDVLLGPIRPTEPFAFGPFDEHPLVTEPFQLG